MPKAFDSWTVLPHKPLDKLEDNLWTVSGKLGATQRRMTLAKLLDGRIIVHNGIALEETSMGEIEAWGTVAAIVVPNGFHRMDSKIWKARYPNAKVYCPKGATKKVSQVLSVDGDYAAIPADRTVRAFHLDGLEDGEGVLEVRSGDGVTLVFNDSILNLPPTGGFWGFMLAPTGKISVPRATRWFVIKNKQSFVDHLKRLSATEGLRRLIFAHGATCSEDPASVLRAVVSDLS
ncbi:MAG: hypothetical protein HY791_22220 [Deltaproteobacteria bacterium]|nr:hypothetical protein [Deltaproteobacteria bacterium]